MPYSGPDDASLPSNVKKHSSKRRRQWIHVYDSARAKGMDEGRAMRMANGVIKGTKEMLFDQEILFGQKYLDSWDVERRQFSQIDAEYDPYGAADGEGCASCNWFVSPNTCVLVAGQVAPTGRSRFYMEPEEYEPDPVPVYIVDNKELGAPTVGAKSETTGQSLIQRVLGWIAPKPAVEEERPSFAFSLKEMADGRLRYVAAASNNFEDRSGEYFGAKAQEDFVAYCDECGEYPTLNLWHAIGSEFGEADWLDWDGHFLWSSGLIYSGKEDLARELASDPDMAMSHGFLARYNGNEAVQFRMFEQSVLPREAAANPWTKFDLGAKEVAFTAAKRTFLASKGFSEKDIASMEAQTAELAEKLKAQGIGFKELEEDTPAGETQPAVPAAVAAATGVVTEDRVRELINEAVSPLTDMAAGIAELREGFKEFSGGADAWFAKQYESRVGGAGRIFEASKDPSTVRTGTKEGGGAPTAPDISWLNEKVLVGPLLGGGTE